MWQCQRMKEKGLQSRTTTTLHGNRKGWIELAIFFKALTHAQFLAKYHGCCAFRWNLGVGDVVLSKI